MIRIDTLYSSRMFLETWKEQECIVSFIGFPKLENITDKVTVSIGSNCSFSYNVNINWKSSQKGLEDLRQYGLRWRYTTKFFVIYYEDDKNNTLVIDVLDGKRILLTY